MKIVSVRRSAAVGSMPASVNQPKTDSERVLECALLAAVEAGGGDRGDHHGGRAGDRRPGGRRRERAAPLQPAVAGAEDAEPAEHPEVDGEDLALLAPLLDPEDGHHRQRVDGVDEGGDRSGLGIEDRPRRCRRRPRARRRRAGRSRPASARAARGRRRWAASWPAIARKPPPTARPIARHGLKGRKRSPSIAEKKGKPSQQVTKRKVRAKLRSGASVPSRPGVDGEAEQEDADAAAEDLRRECRAGRGRAPPRAGATRICSKRGLRQPAASAKKETIRTIDAPQANSQAGTGRSCLEARACASGRKLTG